MKPRTARVAVEKYYSVAETACLLGFSEKFVRGRLKAGEFPGAVAIEKDIRIPASAINGWLQEHELRGPEEVVSRSGVFARSKGELRRRLRAMEGSSPNVCTTEFGEGEG
jgi:hypothetical protein